MSVYIYVCLLVYHSSHLPHVMQYINLNNVAPIKDDLINQLPL